MNRLWNCFDAQSFHDWLDDAIEEADAPKHVSYDEVRALVLQAILWSVDPAGRA